MANTTTSIILKTKALAIGYQSGKSRQQVAADIDLAIPSGTLVGLVGANGIGKSTLLRTLSGIQPPLDGAIVVQGKPLAGHNKIQLAEQLSVVLTEGYPSKNLTVQELVSLGRYPHTNWVGTLTERDKEVVLNSMGVTEIAPLRHRKCFELSDGQLQRVIIARALAQDTPLILLDEPTTHLDLYHRAYILQLLKRLAGESGKTILFSTHEIDLAIQLADLMIVMTADETFFDAPCNLISKGHFETLFPKEIIGFDPQTGRFTIQK